MINCNMMKKTVWIAGVVSAFFATTLFFPIMAHAEVWATRLPADKNAYENPKNPYKELKIPTEITKIGDKYFIVDCYHDQILYSTNQYAPLPEWKVMCTQAKQPHTIAGDGTVYLVDDTENQRELVFEWVNGRFQNTQVLNNMGYRPHCTVYDAATGAFYVWSSMTGEMFVIRREPTTNTVYIANAYKLDELWGVYVRSFTIIGDQIYLPAGDNGYAMVVDKATFRVLGRYPVPASMSGMAQIVPIGNMLYVTISTDANLDQSAATMVRTPSLQALSQGIYEDVYGAFGTTGTPYYITNFDGAFYLANHRSKKGIFRFGVNEAGITNVQAMH